jgi:response regulator NasT
MKEVSTLQDRLDARKSVERAKGVVMERDGVNEAEAYRRIQQQSMNQRVSMREVAEAILIAEGA